MDRVLVYADFGAEQFELGGLLEILDELLQAAVLVEMAGNGSHGRCRVGFDGGGEHSEEDARQRHRFGCKKRNDGVKTEAIWVVRLGSGLHAFKKLKN
jgi:hypothetical protein